MVCSELTQNVISLQRMIFFLTFLSLKFKETVGFPTNINFVSHKLLQQLDIQNWWGFPNYTQLTDTKCSFSTENIFFFTFRESRIQRN